MTPHDGIWIATSRTWITEPADAVWHRPADPELLRATLIDCGMAKAVADRNSTLLRTSSPAS